MSVTRDQLTTTLLERFPELSASYRERIAWQPDAGSHAVFGNVFTPYLIKQLRVHKEDEWLAQAFEFIEELSNNREPGVQEVIAHAVLEPILHDPNVLNLAWPRMHETTRRIIWAFAEAGGITRKLPRNTG